MPGGLILRNVRRSAIRTGGAARPMRWAIPLFVLALLPGCSLFVMGGRMLTGDTKTESQFRKATHTDLVKLHSKVLVLCTSSDAVKSTYPSVEFDVLERVTHRLKANGITKLVSTDDVAGWIDEHGGHFDAADLKQLAVHFHAEYILHIDILKFSCNEENSPDLLRGNAEGHVRALKLDDADGKKSLVEVMGSDFVSTYPQGNPVSIDKKSAKNFQQEYTERMSLQLAQTFYDHPPAEEMQ